MTSHMFDELTPVEPDILSSTEHEDVQELSSQLQRLIRSVDSESFQEWYNEREYTRNIRQGQPYFNGASQIPDTHRHSPSSLLQCHRKVHYRNHNSPREDPDPNGLFWFGTRFEEDVILPFLEDSIAGPYEYVTNSLWVDFEPENANESLRIKGNTDPVIVDADANPVLPTEIKTKRTLDTVSSPDEHHLAQIHSYLKGLSVKHDTQLTEGLIIYGGRTHLDIAVFHVTFDTTFWETTVTDWAQQHTEYRLHDELPPAKPRYNWECNVCSYKERCGQGARQFNDIEATGLLPLFVYPKAPLTEYLNYYDAQLTPTLANHYPELVDTYGVLDWNCRGCDGTIPWDEINWNGDVSSPPKCPKCREHGTLRYLSAPQSDQQSLRGEQ